MTVLGFFLPTIMVNSSHKVGGGCDSRELGPANRVDFRQRGACSAEVAPGSGTGAGQRQACASAGLPALPLICPRA